MAGARDCVPVALSVFTYGLVYGLLAAQAGMGLGEIALASGLIFAGASQFVALDMWTHPLPVVALAAMALAVNLRLVLMGASVQPWVAQSAGSARSARFGALKAYGAAFLLADENWALTMGALQRGAAGKAGGPVDAMAYLAGSGGLLWLAWLSSGLAGSVLGAGVDPAAWGLDFAFTAVFLALATGLWRGRADLVPWVCAALLAVLGERFLPGKWYILLGGLGGSLAAALGPGPAGRASGKALGQAPGGASRGGGATGSDGSDRGGEGGHER
ncbi:MAG: AzlC family ABC transporter permease [Desulfovibrionaceae bacterium]|nr:AzlC family ABC transporter permease [Desulfovibrionaceae bacterium]